MDQDFFCLEVMSCSSEFWDLDGSLYIGHACWCIVIMLEKLFCKDCSVKDFGGTGKDRVACMCVEVEVARHWYYDLIHQ